MEILIFRISFPLELQIQRVYAYCTRSQEFSDYTGATVRKLFEKYFG